MIHYAVRLDAPSRHVVHVTLAFPVGPGERALVAMPAWSPGSYLIRDYARFVRDVEASTPDGRPRPVTKVDKSTWAIDAGGARQLVVRYSVYGHDLSVRTNHIDGTHAFLHGPATFLAPMHLRSEPVIVELDVPDGWPVTCALSTEPVTKLAAADLDELYDSPIHVGPVRSYALPAKLPVRLAVWGERAPGGKLDEQRLVADLGAIVDDHVARFGEAPFPHYTFLLMLAHDGYGGLEHRASSANLYHPHYGATRKHYEALLELLSHELFHAWNGKRIAPAALLAIDYAREAYLPSLWLLEGLTSYYDRFALRSAGRITAKSFLEKLLEDWTRFVATPGRAHASLEQASFDAWIKLYRPDESNLNTTVSYYLKGGLVMAVLELEIRRRSDGTRSLADVLRLLWRRYGAERVAYPEDLQPVFEEATGLALGDLFAQQVRGTADPDLAGELAHVGLELRATVDPAQVTDGHAGWLGITTTGIRVTAVFDGGPAHAAGLSPGDEVIAVDGFRASSEADLRNQVAARPVGDRLVLAVFRRHRLVEVAVRVGQAPPTRYEILGVGDAAAAARYQAWLGEPHPGVLAIASVTTTARWV